MYKNSEVWHKTSIFGKPSKVKTITKDGNCLFSVLSYMLIWERNTMTPSKKKMCDIVEWDNPHMKQFLNLNSKVKPLSRNQYVKQSKML